MIQFQPWIMAKVKEALYLASETARSPVGLSNWRYIFGLIYLNNFFPPFTFVLCGLSWCVKTHVLRQKSLIHDQVDPESKDDTFIDVNMRAGEFSQQMKPFIDLNI